MSSQNIVKLYADLTTDSHVNVIAFNPDGNLLATGRDDNQVVVYRTTDWEIIKRIPTKESVESLIWSTNGSLLVTGGHNKEVIIWQTEDWSKVNELANSIEALSMSWNKKYAFLAIGFHDYYDKSKNIVWKTKDWSTINIALDYTPRFLSFDPTNNYIAFSNSYNGIDIFDLPNFNKVVFLDFSDYISDEPGDLTRPTWSSNGKFLAVSSGDGRIRVWSTKDWKVIKTMHLFDYWDEAQYTCQFSPNNNYLLCGGFGLPKLIDTSNWKVVQELGLEKTYDNLSISWHPKSSLFAITGRPSTKVELWEKIE